VGGTEGFRHKGGAAATSAQYSRKFRVSRKGQQMLRVIDRLLQTFIHLPAALMPAVPGLIPARFRATNSLPQARETRPDESGRCRQECQMPHTFRNSGPGSTSRADPLVRSRPPGRLFAGSGDLVLGGKERDEGVPCGPGGPPY